MKLKIIISKWQRTIQLTLFILCANGWETTVLASADNTSVESSSWRLELDNDIYFSKDDNISSGWSLQKYSAVAQSWDTLEHVPEFVRHWGKAIPTLTEDGLIYRVGIAFGQIIQTPKDLSRSDLIKDDVPYAGALTLQTTWHAFNDDEFRGFQITVGVVGPLALGEQTQSMFHVLTHSSDPKGWDNQLENEPVINFNYMRKQKILRWGNPAELSLDMTINGNAGLGNLFTHASMSLELRFGHNMTRGFVSMPDPIGFSMHYMASLKPPNPEAAAFYGSLAFKGTVLAHNIFLDGNTFSDSHSVDKEPLIGIIIAGLHYERKNWGLHFNIMATSDVVDANGTQVREGREQLGSVNIVWRF